MDSSATVVIIIFLFLTLVIVVSLVRQMSRESLLKMFRSRVRIDGYRLFLPEEMLIDLGIVHVKGFWRSSGRSSYYVSEVEVSNSVQLSTKVIELSKICDSPFYVYVDRRSNVLIEAPGFVVGSGRFKGIVTLCLDLSSIPEKAVEVSIGDSIESAVGLIKISGSGLGVSLTWSFSAPKQKKMVYDEKQGMYRVVEEYTAKPRARGSRLEICFKTPDSKRCIPLAISDKLGTSISRVLQFKIKENIVFLHKDVLSSYAYRVFREIASAYVDPIAIGYRPGYITAKLVLDIPLARDIVKEVEL